VKVATSVASIEAGRLEDRATSTDEMATPVEPQEVVADQVQPPAGVGLAVRGARSIGVAVAMVVGVVVLWEVAKVVTGSDDRTMPHSWAIASHLMSETSQGELYATFIARSMWVTGRGALTGLLAGGVLGVLCGVIIARSQLAGAALLPLVVAAQTVPIVAVAPAMVLWLGTGGMSKIAITAYLTFFPVAVATARGIKAVPRSSLDLLHTYSASRWTVLRSVQLPAALPLIFVGLETAAALSVVGAIVAELPFGAREGLGVAILNSWQFYTIRPEALYGVALGACLLGALIVLAIRTVRGVALRNRPEGDVL
jgi:NitT/TauT family transport system permease protein